MRSSSARIDSILAKLNRGEGTAGAMINDDSLYQELTTVMTRVENLLVDISKNPKKYFKFSVF
jgi:phospholipid/cholesterol/gamma-HCH transport system substrate-binding protein